MKLQRIMVATKPWERRLPIAANHARQLSPTGGVEIEIVGSVFDAAVSAGRDRGEIAAQKSQDRTVTAARAGLERLAAAMREVGARVTTRIVWGAPPYEAILASAHDWQADLLVVGTHEPGTPHTRLTDTDWQLLRRAACPLLLVKSAVFGGYRTILAAIDPLPGSDELNFVDGAVLAASRCVAKACGSTVRTIQGFPAWSVIAAAADRGADLVVAAAARQHGFAAAVVGNTAELVAGELECDVLIVPVAEAAPVARGVRSKVG